MKRTFAVLALATIASVGPAFAQAANCDARITDNAHVVSPSDLSNLNAAIAKLVDINADPHVITDNSTAFANTDLYVADMLKNCATWRSPFASGVVPKSNLVVFIVQPNNRKSGLGIYPGASYSKSLNADVRSDIKTNFIVPAFRTGNFAFGLTQGVNQAAIRIAAFTTAAAHPAAGPVTTITHQATDLSGLFTFLWIAFIVIVVVVGIGFLLNYLSSRNRAKREKKKAQLDAIQAREKVKNLLASIGDTLRTQATLGVKVLRAQTQFDNASAEFSSLASQVSFDPSDNSLDEGTYSSIASSYLSILSDLKRIDTRGDDAVAATPAPAPTPSSTVRSHHGHTHAHNHVEEAPAYREPEYREPAYSSAPAPATTTVIHESYNSGSSNDGLLTGVLIGEALADREPAYREPEYRQPEYREESHYEAPSRSYDSPSYDPPSSDSSGWGSSSSDSSFTSDSSSFSDSGGGFSSDSSGGW